MLERIAAWWREEDEVRFLRGLDDRMLEDMGIAREEIAGRVRARPEPARVQWGLPRLPQLF